MSIKMYLLVNQDHSMGKGKIAAQVGHGVSAAVRYMERTANPQIKDMYAKWLKDSFEAKIVLKAPEAILRTLLMTYPHICFPIHDAGKTQIASGSLTVISFLPIPDVDVPNDVKALKLL